MREAETQSDWKKWSHVEGDGWSRTWSEEMPMEADLLISEEAWERSGNAESRISAGPCQDCQNCQAA